MTHTTVLFIMSNSTPVYMEIAGTRDEVYNVLYERTGNMRMLFFNDVKEAINLDHVMCIKVLEEHETQA